MKRECTLVQGKCNKMVTRACRHSITLKTKTVKTWSISFFIDSYSTNYVALSVISTDYYYVTLPIHSHAEVTIGTRYSRQSVSCDVLGERSWLPGWPFWGQISEIWSQLALAGPKIVIWPFSSFWPFSRIDWPLTRIRSDQLGCCLRTIFFHFFD